MIAALFQQFRQKYPTGHLTTELIRLENGQYVIRAALAEGNTPIVTAMAVSDDLDQAEQQAQAKALALLGFASTTSTPLPQPLTAAPPSAPSPTTAPETGPTAVAPAIAPVAAVNLAPVDLTSSAPEDETPLAPPNLEDPSLETPEEIGRPITEIPEPTTSESPMPDLSTDLSAFDSASTDLSDVIAQTDVEMRRLGWSSQQGRDHLTQTYGKRSRQQLTDEELLEFLLYLESQPVPAG